MKPFAIPSLLITLAFGLGSPASAHADCHLEHQACEQICQVKHLTDEAAEMGCKSRCGVQRASCETAEGAKKVSAAGKEALEKAKSFFSGMTGQ